MDQISHKWIRHLQLKSFFTNIMWIPFLCVSHHPSSLDILLIHDSLRSFFFFGGLSIHLSQAILAHLFSYNMTWAATSKEVERSNFFKEVPKILKRFWVALSISIILIAGMIILSTNLVPFEWRVGGEGWAVIFPLA